MGVAVRVMAGAVVDDEADEKQEATMPVGKWVETRAPRPWAVVVVVVVLVLMLADGAMVALRCWWVGVEGRMPAGLCIVGCECECQFSLWGKPAAELPNKRARAKGRGRAGGERDVGDKEPH
jgi:hypothetical protein